MRAWASAICLLILTGCVTPRLSATVEATAAAAADPSWTYDVVAADAAQARDPAFEEIADQLRRGLTGAGLAVAPAGQTADIAVRLRYGVAGPRREGGVTAYDRVLDLTAAPNAAEATPLWSVRVVSRGFTGDARYVAPYLIAAAQPHMGRTSGPVRVDLEEGAAAAAGIGGRGASRR